MVVVVDRRPTAAELFGRRRHAALELVIVVAIEEIVLSVVLVLHHGLDGAQALLEDATLCAALVACAISVASPDEIGFRQIGAVLPALLVDQCLQAGAIGAGLGPEYAEAGSLGRGRLVET